MKESTAQTTVSKKIDYEYYLLQKQTIYMPEDGEFGLVNASIGSCCLCGSMITGMGGTSGMICLECGGMLERGQLRCSKTST